MASFVESTAPIILGYVFEGLKARHVDFCEIATPHVQKVYTIQIGGVFINEGSALVIESAPETVRNNTKEDSPTGKEHQHQR